MPLWVSVFHQLMRHLDRSEDGISVRIAAVTLSPHPAGSSLEAHSTYLTSGVECRVHSHTHLMRGRSHYVAAVTRKQETRERHSKPADTPDVGRLYRPLNLTCPSRYVKKASVYAGYLRSNTDTDKIIRQYQLKQFELGHWPISSLMRHSSQVLRPVKSYPKRQLVSRQRLVVAGRQVVLHSSLACIRLNLQLVGCNAHSSAFHE